MLTKFKNAPIATKVAAAGVIGFLALIGLVTIVTKFWWIGLLFFLYKRMKK